MIKIGNFINGPLLFLLMMSVLPVLQPVQTQAQDVSLDAVLSETKIFTGEQFTLSIEVAHG